MKINNVLPSDYRELLNVWENSVRASHDFITEEDIAFFKPMILEQAFPEVTLLCVKDELGNISGFIGINKQKVEMLFVLDEQRGKGIGRTLMRHVMDNCNVKFVDVNEQNPLAVGFYQRLGFDIVSRSPLDDLGKPFPILHMSL